MRISDWSSDVCSSDLRRRDQLGLTAFAALAAIAHPEQAAADQADRDQTADDNSDELGGGRPLARFFLLYGFEPGQAAPFRQSFIAGARAGPNDRKPVAQDSGAQYGKIPVVAAPTTK